MSYIKIGAMLALCLIVPPLGWLFMKKYSPYDRRTNIIIAVACTAFFANVITASSELKKF